MNELHDLLEQATNRIDSPNLAADALAGARRRRTARRAALAAGVTAGLVAVVAVAGQLAGGTGGSAPPLTPPSQTPTSTKVVAQPRWDPRDAGDLPSAANEVSPLLPDVLDLPSSAPALADEPIAAAVLSIDSGRTTYLLSTDGSWRSVPLSLEYGGSELTTDGTRLAVQTETGVDVWDLPTGQRTRLDNPDGYAPVDPVPWVWVDTATLLLDDPQPEAGGWLVDADSGAATVVPYPTSGLGWWATVDPKGVVVESADYGRPVELTDWAGGEPRRVDMRDIGRLATIRADSDTVVGTSDAQGAFSVFVAGRADLAPRAILPLVDPGARYANGGLQVAALLDDGTVLLRVAAFDDEMNWRLVAWQPDTGDLSTLTRTTGGPVVLMSYATGLLG
ncbi:MAG: hypothetical protein JWN22_453 [Nocardioides sp.]|nr:hypothetical protein [Nocardioides sp.]